MQTSAQQIIPKSIQEEGFIALSHYPELNETPITFKFKRQIKKSTMLAQPDFRSLFAPRERRRYKVLISEKIVISGTEFLTREIPEKVMIGRNLKSINLSVANLRNVIQRERTLPSELHATAISIGQGYLKLEGNMNLVKQIPDMDITLSLQDADAVALNDFTKHYAGIDFESGQFEVFG